MCFLVSGGKNVSQSKGRVHGRVTLLQFYLSKCIQLTEIYKFTKHTTTNVAINRSEFKRNGVKVNIEIEIGNGKNQQSNQDFVL